MMTAISGRNLRGLFEKSDLASLWVRMCRESLVWKVALTGYSLTWKAAATPAGRSLYRLRLSAPTTAGTGCGLWPTANAANAANDITLTCSGDGREKPNKLGWAVAQRLWMTPKAGDADFHSPSTSDRPREMSTHLGTQVMFATPRTEGFDAGKHRGKADSLHSQVKMLPTPVTTDHKQHSSPAATSGKSPQLGPTVGSTSGMKLSAAWVGEFLMGYPRGWMDDLPTDPLAPKATTD